MAQMEVAGQPRVSALRRFLVWTLIGGAAGVVATLLVVGWMSRDPTPPLTPQIFENAHERWKSAAPQDYDIEVKVSGPQAATYRTEVRRGQPQAAWRNGEPLVGMRTFGTWSVPGMFSTISRDLESIQRRAEGRAMPGAPELILKAQFDSRYSFPQSYRRIEWGSRRGSDAVTVKWDVVEFKIVAP